MEFPKLVENPRTPFTIGLKTATKGEIIQYLKTIRKYGAKAVHKTHASDGSKLPFNGVINVNINLKREISWTTAKLAKRPQYQTT